MNKPPLALSSLMIVTRGTSADVWLMGAFTCPATGAAMKTGCDLSGVSDASCQHREAGARLAEGFPNVEAETFDPANMGQSMAPTWLLKS